MINREQALIDLEKKLKTTLPEDYKNFLLTYDGRQNYMHKKIKGKYWQLGSLCDELGFYILGKNFCKGLEMHAQVLKENTNSSTTKVTGTKQTFKLDHLSKCIVIGYENGDSLFLNPEDNSIWSFWHDGGDCQKLENNFSSWIKNSKEEYEPLEKMVTDSKFKGIFNSLVGIWESVGNNKNYLELREDGTAQDYYSDGSGSKGEWRVINKNEVGILLLEENYDPEEEKHKIVEQSEVYLKLFENKYEYTSEYNRVEVNKFKK